jgi:peptidoglycan hydrolase-like protein with peptidoglycan-binding domain
MTHALDQEAQVLEDLPDVETLDEATEDVERVEAAFEPGSHPRAPAGSATGGEFAPGGGGGSSRDSPSKPKAAPKRRGTSKGGHSGGGSSGPARTPVPKGQLGYDGQTGTGYGATGGDAAVKSLQTELARLHVADSHGHKLAADGKFGPLTTDAVKEAQRRLGMQPTGIVAPAFIDRLKSLKSLPGAHAKTPKVKAAARIEAGELLGIELVRPGTWQLSSGEQAFTAEMIRDAARHAARPGARPAPIKLGHADPRFAGDGEPALGWLGNLRVVDDGDMPVLVGDVTGMPDWLAAAAPTAWPDRSVEGWTDLEVDGEKYSFVIDGLALLGVTPPGISSIRSLRDLPQALGIAASARIVARAPGGTPVLAATAPAPEAEAPPTTPEETGMDPAKIREACGLPADASDDEVTSTLTAAGYVPAQAEPVAAAATREAPGTMRVDASAWQEREERLKRLEASAQKARDSERDQIITAAVKAGKFTPARREHWVRAWNADPEGARELIASLANVVPVGEMGFSDGDADADEAYAALYGKQKVG